MADQGKTLFNQFADEPALIAQRDKVLALFNDVKNGIKGLSDLGFKIDGAKSVGELKNAVNELAPLQAKLAATQSDAAKEATKYNVQIQEQTKSNKEAAREALGLNDAYKKLEQQAAASTKAAKAAGAQFGANSEQFKTASAEAKRLNDNLKEIDKAVGLNQRNVGNYSESFTVLSKELDNVTAKIKNFSTTSARDGANGFNSTPRGGPQPDVRAASDDYQQLVKQQTALQQVVSNNARGFTSLTQELRSNERGLQTLRAAGLQGSEAFKTLQEKTDESKRSFNEFAKEQKILESQTPVLTGLTVAAKGLAGAYAVGAGSAALFGDEEGKIQKEVEKLVAIMTVLQGLQEAHELLEQKGAIATAIHTAAQKTFAFVVGESTGALKLFRIALAATVAGLVLIGIAYIIENFQKLTGAAKITEKGFEDLKGVSNSTKEALKEYGETIDKITDGAIKDLEGEVKKLNDEFNLTPTAVQKAAAALQLAGNELERIKKQRDSFNDLGKKSLGESFQDIGSLIGIGKDRLKEAQERVDKLKEIVSQRDNLQVLVDNKALKDAAIKAITEQANLQIDANGRVLANDKTTLAQRLAAVQSNFEERSRLIRINAANDEENAKTPVEIVNIRKKAAADQLLALRDSLEQQSKEKEKFAERDRKATSEINNASIADQIKVNEQVIAADDAPRTDRLVALSQFVRLRGEQIVAAAEFEKNTGLKTAKELEAIEAKKNSELLALALDAQNKKAAILGKEVDPAKALGEKGLAANLAAFITTDDANKKFQDDAKKKEEAIKKIKDAAKQLGEALVDLGFSLAGADIENDLAAIQKQIELVGTKNQKDIEGVNQLGLAEKDKAKLIAEINAQTAQDNEQLAKRQRQLEREKARLDREKAIASIIENTAVAITSALEIPVYGEVLAGIIAALGAAQIAKVLATPLPAYEHGVTNAPAGVARVSEKGQELIIDRHGNLKLTPKTESLVELAGGENIYPAHSDITKRVIAGFDRQKAGVFNSVIIAAGPDNKELLDRQQEQIELLKEIRNKPTTMIRISDNSGFIEYERRNLQS